MSGISFIDLSALYLWKFFLRFSFSSGEINRGANGTETGEGEVGDNSGADERDDGGRVDMIGDTEEEDVDVDEIDDVDAEVDDTDNEDVDVDDTDDGDVDIDDTGGGDVDMDDETVVGEVGGADEIDRVDVIEVTEDDSGRETTGTRGSPDCSMSLLFTPSSSSST